LKRILKTELIINYVIYKNIVKINELKKANILKKYEYNITFLLVEVLAAIFTILILELDSFFFELTHYFYVLAYPTLAATCPFFPYHLFCLISHLLDLIII
jgi:hypothetical protein